MATKKHDQQFQERELFCILTVLLVTRLYIITEVIKVHNFK